MRISISSSILLGAVVVPIVLLSNGCIGNAAKHGTAAVSEVDRSSDVRKIAEGIDYRPYLASGNFFIPWGVAHSSQLSPDEQALQREFPGTASQGWVDRDLTASEIKLKAIWRPVPGANFTINSVVNAIQIFYMNEGHLPLNSLEIIDANFNGEGAYQHLSSLSMDERVKALGGFINPATGHYYESFTAQPNTPFGISVNVVPKAQWDSSYPDTGHWVTSSGNPAPIQYALHLKVYGERPGTVLLDRIQYFGRR